jgi:hypothetical protein
VGGIVVEDNVDQLACRDVVLDGIEEANEFAMTVAPQATVDQPSTLRQRTGWWCHTACAS